MVRVLGLRGAARACCRPWAASASRWTATSASWSAPTRSSCPARPTCTATPRSSSWARCGPPTPAAPGWSRSARARSCWPRPGCWTGAARRPTGATRRCWRAATRGCGWRRTCSTSTATTCSPRPARPPASTCACTWCARDHGADVANRVARRMVVAAHRDGGQAQFIDLPGAGPAGRRPGRRRDGVGARAPARAHRRGRPGPPRAPLAAPVQPPLPRRHGRQPGRVAAAPAPRRGPAAARVVGRAGRARRRPASASPPRRRSGAISRARTEWRLRPGGATSRSATLGAAPVGFSHSP